MSAGCSATASDGGRCYNTPFVFDPRRHGMLCRDHALEPLRRTFGSSRPDLEEKAELVLRFLALPPDNRHEILEGLSVADRREFIDLARLFDERGA